MIAYSIPLLGVYHEEETEVQWIQRRVKTKREEVQDKEDSSSAVTKKMTQTTHHKKNPKYTGYRGDKVKECR